MNYSFLELPRKSSPLASHHYVVAVVSSRTKYVRHRRACNQATPAPTAPSRGRSPSAQGDGGAQDHAGRRRARTWGGRRSLGRHQTRGRGVVLLLVILDTRVRPRRSRIGSVGPAAPMWRGCAPAGLVVAQKSSIGRSSWSVRTGPAAAGGDDEPINLHP